VFRPFAELLSLRRQARTGLTLGWGFSGLTSHLKINPGKIWIILDNPDLHFFCFLIFSLPVEKFLHFSKYGEATSAPMRLATPGLPEARAKLARPKLKLKWRAQAKMASSSQISRRRAHR
jgi:hypothetical protein